MTMRRAAGLLLGLVASLAAVPAQAAQPALSLAVALRWDSQAQPGAWSPYVVTVKDAGGADFTGDVFLVAHQSRFNGPATPWPSYQSRVTVGRGSERSVTIYALEAPSGYQAQLRDLSGRVLLTAELQGSGRAGLAVGMLSDNASADTTVRNLNVLQAAISTIRFPSAQAFPTNEGLLTGLQAIVIDDFDASALSQAQVQALRDFVGFGGSLIVGGGASWRRTMLSLPVELLPLKPTGTVSESMQPLADLGGHTTSIAADVAIGDLVNGESVLQGLDRVPLLVESRYGGGQVILLTYDPLADPIASDPQLAAIGWAQGLARALLNSATSINRGFGPAVGTAIPYQTAPQPVQPGAVATAPAIKLFGPPAEFQIWQYLRDTPAAAAPPVLLLGIALILYVLFVGPVIYLALKGLGRRELAWVAVPLIAVVVTFGSYTLGFGSRGADFVDNEIELQQLAPTGDVQATAFHALFLPRRGNYTIDLASNQLAATGSDALYGGSVGSQPSGDTIVSSSRPRVLLSNVAVWSMRSLETLTVQRQPIALDASLSMSHARLQGKVTNRGPRPLADVRFYNYTGQVAIVAGDLPPGATVSVDAAFQSVPISVQRAFAGQMTSLSPLEKREAMMLIASGDGLQHSGDLALVAVSDPLPGPAILGATATRTATAIVVAPVQLSSADQLPAGYLSPALVSVANATPNWVDIYDLELPPGLTQPLTLRYVTPNLTGRSPQLSPGTVEVYDWSAGSWRALPMSNTRQGSVTLEPGVVAGGVVRVRVRESSPINQAQLQLVAGADMGTG
jgi:hypothetical protein